ncbi:MAG: response regulator [Bacteroidales bacterium]|nr:response regulator [Bacteroidales bacterium]
MINRHHIAGLSFLIFCLSLACGAQPPSGSPAFRDLTARTGVLPVHAIAQQEQGRIWLGTNRCLYSFDGYDLTPCPAPEGHLQANCLLSCGDDLLLGTNSGLYLFNPEERTYRKVPTLEESIVRALREDGDGEVLVATDSGLFRFHPGEEDVQRIAKGNFFSIATSPETLWFGTAQSVLACSRDDDELTRLEEAPRLTVAAALLCDGDCLWVGTAGTLLQLDKRTGAVLKQETMPIVKTLVRCPEGILVGTDAGLYLYNPDRGGLRKIRQCVTLACTVDRDGLVWLGTDNGLFQMRNYPVIQRLTGFPGENESRYESLLYDSQDRTWLGGSQGILLLKEDGTHRHYSMTGSEYHIPHNKINRIVEDRNSGAVLAATDGGYLRFDDQTEQFVRHTIPGTQSWVYDLLPGRGDLWAATFNGLFRLRPDDGSVVARYTREDGLSSNDVSRIVRDRMGDIWILTRDQQVFRLDPVKDILQPFSFESEKEGPIRADCITGDTDGRVWICDGNLLLRVTPDAEGMKTEVIPFLPDPAAEAYSITDTGESVGICTSAGLFAVDKENLSIHGLGTYQKYISIAYDSRQGRLLLGRNGAVDAILIEDIRQHYRSGAAPISLTGVIVNGQERLSEEELRKEEIRFPYGENHLDISFSDFNYNDEFPHRFNYRLDGRRNGWSGTVTGNKITLTALKPGRYQLSVGPADTDSPLQELFSFRIRRPWHLSPVMLALYLLLLALTVNAAIRAAMMRKTLEMERRSRDEISHQFQQKSAFFQDVAHEFKTPLSLIIGPLGKLIKEAGPDTDVKSLQMVQENAMRLSAMIHRTIDFYKDNDTTDSLISSDVEFVDFARSIFESWRENSPQHEFIFNSSHPRIPVSIDIVKIETVLNNLLSNACKYTPDGGSVLLTLERDDAGGKLVIKISDTGIGIPEAELPFAFTRYFESSRSKQGGYESTGIGLSVVRKYVELHQGTVAVDSDKDGTSFTIVLPCLVSEGQSDAAGPDGLADQDDGKPLVAIVDDNAQICNFIESLLKDDYRCVSSHNGKSGLKLCRDVLPDLVISDVLMPVMDGLEMCRQIRQYGPLSTIPIILLTAKDDKETEQQSIGLNIDVFLPKPFEVSTLTARVGQLLGNKQRMEQKIRLEMLASPTATRELSQDERFLKKVTGLIEDHLDDADLSVARLCELGEFSEKQLYRKVKQFTGLAPVEYIRSIRLKKAALLLQSGSFTVSEVMYSVGFSNASYFTRVFTGAFHMTPSDYMKSFKNK